MHKTQSNFLSSIITPKVVSEPDPDTGHFNPFPTFPYTGTLRPVYPLSERRAVPKSIQHPDYWQDGNPKSERTFTGRTKIQILNKEEQEGMRKVCRLAREVLDIAAAAAKPGVTTDYIDEIVHKACLEREVSKKICSCIIMSIRWLTIAVISLASKLLPFPKIGLHFAQRSHLPRHSRPKSSARRRYSQP